MPANKGLDGFKIPKVGEKRAADFVDPGPSTSNVTFDVTTPGAATGNQQAGPELIKRARTMRFEGRLDKGKQPQKKF